MEQKSTQVTLVDIRLADYTFENLSRLQELRAQGFAGGIAGQEISAAEKNRDLAFQEITNRFGPSDLGNV